MGRGGCFCKPFNDLPLGIVVIGKIYCVENIYLAKRFVLTNSITMI